MKIATILSTAFLLVAPGLAIAMCPDHEQTAQSCADGYVWSGELGQCVQQVTG